MHLIEFHYGVKDYNILMPPTSLCAFFPNGKSSNGNQRDLRYAVWNYQLEDRRLYERTTVGQMFKNNYVQPSIFSSLDRKRKGQSKSTTQW